MQEIALLQACLTFVVALRCSRRVCGFQSFGPFWTDDSLRNLNASPQREAVGARRVEHGRVVQGVQDSEELRVDRPPGSLISFVSIGARTERHQHVDPLHECWTGDRER